MPNDCKIIYPHGGGGSWLSNLIYNLETSNFVVEPATLYFDGRARTTSIEVRHKFEYETPGNIIIKKFAKNTRVYLFSSNKPFNLFLNENKKIHYNEKIYNNQILPFNEQLELLSQRAHNLITDPYFKEYYFTNIDLDVELIFTAPDKFIKKLFEILDYEKIKFHRNEEFCFKSIDNYKNTCANPIDYIGNLDSIFWVGWCQGILMHHNPQLLNNFDFVNAANINEVKKALSPLNQLCIDLTASYCFLWK